MKLYDKEFYDNQHEGSIRSASSFLSKLFGDYMPSSIIDFGCGVGSWLYAAEKLGVNKLTGLDGEWVNNDNLLSPSINFQQINFESENYTTEKHDLAISVEVAEHFDKKYAERFIRLITESSDLIIFGAAVPLQGGKNHINEQPQSYWINKFNKYGFRCFDYFRPTFWNDQNVEVWYRQNTFLFVRESCIETYKFLNDVKERNIIDIIHPELYIIKSKRNLVPQRADKLRDAAIELEKDDLNLSYILMKMALAARPTGPFLLEKVKQYEDKLKK